MRLYIVWDDCEGGEGREGDVGMEAVGLGQGIDDRNIEDRKFGGP